MTTKEMVSSFLTDNGYDGLVSDVGECACLLSDLMPCGEPEPDCEAGYRWPCDCGEGCEFHIGIEPYNREQEFECE